jgi:hypothetical protein
MNDRYYWNDNFMWGDGRKYKKYSMIKIILTPNGNLEVYGMIGENVALWRTEFIKIKISFLRKQKTAWQARWNNDSVFFFNKEGKHVEMLYSYLEVQNFIKKHFPDVQEIVFDLNIKSSVHATDVDGQTTSESVGRRIPNRIGWKDEKA